MPKREGWPPYLQNPRPRKPPIIFQGQYGYPRTSEKLAVNAFTMLHERSIS